MIYEGGRPSPGKDDGLVISLLRTNSDIQTYFRHTGHLLPNQLATNLRLEVDCGKLAYYDWVGTKCGHHLVHRTCQSDKDMRHEAIRPS